MPITGYSNTISVTTLAPSFDPDAQAFFDRVTTAGGTLSETEKTATNQLVLDMKSAGIWSSMKAVYPMVGASAAACAQNLKSSSFTGTFTSGWTFASTGVTPNGTSAFFNTGLNPSTALASQNSSHMSYYSRTSNDGTFIEMGAENIPRIVMHIKYSGVAYYDQNDQTAGGRLSFSMSAISSACFAIMSRTANNLQIGQVNGVNRGTNTNTNISSLPNANIYVGAFNGSSVIYTNRQCAFASIGDGLTNTQASNFYTAVQAFQTTLSRNV
jgi:hypothetical protein